MTDIVSAVNDCNKTQIETEERDLNFLTKDSEVNFTPTSNDNRNVFLSESNESFIERKYLEIELRRLTQDLKSFISSSLEGTSGNSTDRYLQVLLDNLDARITFLEREIEE